MTTEPDAVDVHVGQRIRDRRVAMGLSQTDLAKALGLTFQQVQKYERATNRVSASKLARIAAFLKVPVSYFFPEDDADLPAATPEEAARRAFIETRHGARCIDAIMGFSASMQSALNDFAAAYQRAKAGDAG